MVSKTRGRPTFRLRPTPLEPVAQDDAAIWRCSVSLTVVSIFGSLADRR